MSVPRKQVRRLLLTAFTIWFVHFVLCWAAVEIWPDEARANHLAWVFTAIALLAMGWHARALRRGAGPGDVVGFSQRFARGATAIATVAVLFTALASAVIVP